MFDWLTDAVSGSPISYLVVLIASGADVVFPPVPSETIVITSGIVAAKGGLSVALLIPLAALGAFCGDNLSYWLGRRIGDPIADRAFRSETAKARLAWAEKAIGRRGAILIVIGRFVPGGRTASTFAAGTLEMPWRRFAAADALAVVLWAIVSVMIGYLGGTAFKASSWKPFAVSLGIAALLGLGIEVWRRVQRRQGRDILGDPVDEP